MADNLIDDIKIVLSADDKAAKGPIDDLIAKLDGIGKAAEGNGNATKEFFDRIAKGGEEASKSMGKLADAAGKSGKGVKGATKGFSEIADSAERVVPAADDAKKALDGMGDAGDKAKPLCGDGKYLAFLDSLADKAMKAGSALKAKLAAGAMSAGKALAKLAIAPFAVPLKSVTGAIAKFGSAVSGLFRQIKRVAMYRMIRSAIRMVTDGFREGTQNAYQWSKALGGTFAASMDTLATSSLYLKNSLGALATPLINAVAPAIDWIIDKFVTLLNVVNQVIALLTGAKTWTKAIKYPKEYAAATNDAAGGAGKLSKAMTTILAIDELNPLNGDKGGGGGGGGGGAGALDYSSMFEEQNVATSWIEDFKSAWESGDFTSIGETIGRKINEALAGIPWSSIQATVNNIASSIATLLNGAISAIDWTLVGTTVAQGMNTILGFFKTYAEKFDFSAAGAAIGQAISGWARNFDWAGLGTTISLWAKGFLDLLTNAIENIDWYALGSGISEAIKNIDWADLISRAFRLIGSLVGAFSSFIEGLLSDFKEAFEKFWDYDTLKESGTDTWEGFLKGIVEGIKNIGRWIYDNIFEPFITGVKNAFGIHSPSTVMEEQGGYVMDGFLNGLTNGLQSILEFFGGLVTSITNFFKDPIGSIKVAITGLVDKIPSAKKVITGIAGWVSTFKDKITGSKTLKNFTANITARNDKIQAKNKTLTGFQALITDKSDKMKTNNKKLDGFQALIYDKSDRLSKGQKTIDGMTATFNKSQNAMTEEQRRFYATARFNQSQNALGTPTINAKANFTDYSSEFSKVKMPIQITAAYRPDGVRIDIWKAEGGAFYGGKWHDIAQYATGGVPNHGSLFMAGEAGAEIVGHVGGRTEVLNQSQIASTIAAATQMSNASQNSILVQLLNGVEQLIEGQGDVRAYIPAGEVVSGLQRNNRRDGRALVPMGV